MKPLDDVRIDAEWLREENLQTLFDALAKDDAQTLIAGGAVRNALMGEAVGDVDLCTTLLPEEVVEQVSNAGMKAVPTGIEHGTVTVVVGDAHFEVTTLREDVETDGRHAVVKFGKDWQQDASRRDLTINALYCDRLGQVFDPLEGYGDVCSREVRFIGDAAQRIKEDALRILRFFRFFAQYGSGRPDAAGLKACSSHKDLLGVLSSERVWMELKKILAADDPGRTLLWMRTTGILNVILPETEKWGIDHVPALVRLEKRQSWAPDAMLRLMGIIRPHVETVQKLAQRLSMSNKELERLEHWAQSGTPSPDTDADELAKLLYRGCPQGMLDALKIEAVHKHTNDESDKLEHLISQVEFAAGWERPVMPVQGRDLIDLGMKPGPEMGEALKRVEEAWIESNFTLGKDALLKDLEH